MEKFSHCLVFTTFTTVFTTAMLYSITAAAAAAAAANAKAHLCGTWRWSWWGEPSTSHQTVV